MSRAHSAAGAPTQIRGWARTGVSTCGGRGRRLHCAAWCLVVCPRRRARPKPHSPPAAGEGGGFTARRGRVSAQFLLAPTIHPHAPTFLAYHACTLILSSVYVGSTVFRVLLLYSVIHPRRAHVFCGPSPHAPQGSVGEGKASQASEYSMILELSCQGKGNVPISEARNTVPERSDQSHPGQLDTPPIHHGRTPLSLTLSGLSWEVLAVFREVLVC